MATITPAQRDAEAIFRRYLSYHSGEVQGCCVVIADVIQREIGGEVVAGELTWFGGSCRRTHWWVDLNGLVLDPMGDWLLEKETAPGRYEEHRDRATFDAILPRYDWCRMPEDRAALRASQEGE